MENKLKFRGCTNENCGVVCMDDECLSYKHSSTNDYLCPACNDTTEEMEEKDVTCQACEEIFEIKRPATVHFKGLLGSYKHLCAEHFCMKYPNYRVPMGLGY